MITIVLTNRNRDIQIVKNCLESLQGQTDIDFEWFLVDYGSDKDYLKDLELVIQDFSRIKFISCPTQVQLWNKSIFAKTYFAGQFLNAQHQHAKLPPY